MTICRCEIANITNLLEFSYDLSMCDERYTNRHPLAFSCSTRLVVSLYKAVSTEKKITHRLWNSNEQSINVLHFHYFCKIEGYSSFLQLTFLNKDCVIWPTIFLNSLRFKTGKNQKRKKESYKQVAMTTSRVQMSEQPLGG